MHPAQPRPPPRGHGCSPAAQQCFSSLSSSGLHLGRATCRTGQGGSRVRQCPGGRHGRWCRTGAWTGSTAFELGGNLHGELRVGMFLGRTGTDTRAQHVCPHACCSAVPSMLTHVFVACTLAATVVDWVSATLGALGQQGPHIAQTDSWPSAATHPAGPSKACGSGCGWPCSPACLGLSGQRRHSQQPSSQPGLCQHASWRTCGPHSSRTGSCWAGGCAGSGAYAQPGTGEGTHGLSGKLSWSAGATAGCCARCPRTGWGPAYIGAACTPGGLGRKQAHPACLSWRPGMRGGRGRWCALLAPQSEQP